MNIFNKVLKQIQCLIKHYGPMLVQGAVML